MQAQSANAERNVASADTAAAAKTPPAGSSMPDVNRTGRQASAPAEQDLRGELPLGEEPDNHLLVPFVKHLASDQHTFWTTPAHFRVNDLKWIAPFAGITTGFIAGDSWISKQIPLGKVQTSKTVSDYGAYSLIA